jgi:threonylcarbamoyladenosine tRNA methylthiotransferase MtaB
VDLTDRIREAVPGMAIWTDVIAGFPGETNEEFADTLATVDRVAFDGIHVFRYSPRSGTRAATMPDQVTERIRKERSDVLLQRSAVGKRRFAQRLVGSEVEVLFEEDGSGLTDNYVRVMANGGQPNTFGRVRVLSVAQEGVTGALIDG